MEWVGDGADAGRWLVERIDDPWRGSMHDVVPRGFPSYARVFHPTDADRPMAGQWPPLPYARHLRAWDAFMAHGVHDVERRSVSWSEAAAMHGTTWHPLAQWGSLVRQTTDTWESSVADEFLSADGWRVRPPQQGQLDAAVWPHLARTLAAHSDTDEIFVALWEGHGALVESTSGTGRVFLSSDGQAAAAGGAVLSREISAAPRLQLPNRGFVVFRGTIGELSADDWPLDVPWRDRIAESYGFAPSALSPSIVWSSDQAWVSVSEVDLDSTVVGGPPALIDAVCAAEGIEALPIDEGAHLDWDADKVNR